MCQKHAVHYHFNVFKGEEKRAVGCMRGNQEVEPRECSTPKPEDQRACRTQCLLPSNTFKWRTGAWSDVRVIL